MASVTVDMAQIDVALDLERRVAAIPDAGAIRGVFFNQIEEYLQRELKLDGATLREVLGESHRSYKMYSARDAPPASPRGPERKLCLSDTPSIVLSSCAVPSPR